MTDDLRFKKWGEWIEVIYKEVENLLVDRQVYGEVQEIIQKNARLVATPSTFYGLIATGHVASMVMGVRRQVKADSDSISMMRLLKEIVQTPAVLTRARYVALFDDPSPALSKEMHAMAERQFDGLVGQGAAHIDRIKVQEEIDVLKSKSGALEELADRRFAHRDRRPPSRMPTFDELNECLDFLEKLVIRYQVLLRAMGTTTLVPTWQYDWKEIFRFPWIPPE